MTSWTYAGRRSDAATRFTVPNLSTLRQLNIGRHVPEIGAGTVGALVTLSYAASYAAMIFAGPLAVYESAGVSAALVTCGIVSILIALRSSFPFVMAGPDSNSTAVLAVMAVALATQMGTGPATLPTLLMMLFLSAAGCGAILYLLGAARAGRYVRYIPYPVVGGFLAGTGYFVMNGAARVMTGHSIGAQAVAALPDVSPLTSAFPIVLAALLIVLTRRTKHPLVVPGVLLGGILAFFVMLALTGTSIAAARSDSMQLLLHPLSRAVPQTLFHVDRSAVDWTVLLSQGPAFLAMTVVVVITILLNSTGLDSATGHDVDFEQELKASGAANVVVGLAGGMVGYISFTRSFLNYRAGSRTRLAPIITGLLCLFVTFVIPGVMGFLPRPVLTGLLLYLGFGLLFDWVVVAYRKLPLFEYVLLLIIFALIVVYGFITGVTLGIVIAGMLFVFNYSRSSPIKHVLAGATSNSNVHRSTTQVEYLRDHGDLSLGLVLQGYLFFGTARQIVDHVRPKPPALRYLLVDFHSVQGVDASALFSFEKLKQICEKTATKLIFTDLPESIDTAFRRIGLLADDTIRVFADRDRGQEWIEEHILAARGRQTAPSARVLDYVLSPFFSPGELATLRGYLTMEDVKKGTVIAKQNDASDAMFFVEYGQVSFYLNVDRHTRKRLRTYVSGTIVGEMGFYSNAPRSADIIAEESTRLYRMGREDSQRMEQEDPALAIKLHRYVIRLVSSRLQAANNEIESLL